MQLYRFRWDPCTRRHFGCNPKGLNFDYHPLKHLRNYENGEKKCVIFCSFFPLFHSSGSSHSLYIYLSLCTLFSLLWFQFILTTYPALSEIVLLAVALATVVAVFRGHISVSISAIHWSKWRKRRVLQPESSSRGTDGNGGGSGVERYLVFLKKGEKLLLSCTINIT